MTLFRPHLVLALALPLVCSGNDREVFALVQKYCAGCHNANIKSGDVNLSAFTSAKSFDENRETWERVVSKLKTGEMPPSGVPKPPAAEIAGVTRWLEAEFARQDATVKPDAGRVTARRLNRNEYNNTIRDLLGVDIKPAENFPADEAAFGFDNISDALNLSPVLLEKYVDAAEHSVRTALFGPEVLKPAAIHYPTPVRINDTVQKPTLPKDLFHYDFTGLSTVHSGHAVHRFPVDGEYGIRLVLNGHRPNQSEPVHPALFIDGKLIKEFEVDATDLEGQIVEVRTQITAGEHLLSATYLNNYSGLPPRYKGPNPSTRPPEPLITVRGALTAKDIETLRKYGTKIKTDRIETRVDNRFESIDVQGPFSQTKGPSAVSLRKIYVCGHAPGKHTDACARTIVSSFAGRAFRRPATAKEVDSYLKFVSLAKSQGDSFEEGVATALQAVLVSPNFLFRIERDRTPAAGRTAAPLSDYELASRLSYFLWSSTPDAELLKVAGEGKLRQPAVLTAQVQRMLADDKAKALVENFAGQWLQFKNIDVVKPDVNKFPAFEESLRLAMRRETELFIDSIFRQDGSVLQLLDADYTFVNERLARFYGIPDVTGPEFRRVSVAGTKRGGGILAQGSILTISSYSTRTSPVVRGKWVLENLLNAPPPPPPPSVPALDDTKIGQSASLRQQMEQHRKDPVCASCHSRMDPLGFGLENFDGIGEWREVDGKFPVDASGLLPGGKTFNGPVELKALLKADSDAFVNGLTEKLLTYALGRGLERYDRPVVAKIAAALPAKNYRFSQLVIEIVNSLPFQMRRGRESQIASAKTGDKSQ